MAKIAVIIVNYGAAHLIETNLCSVLDELSNFRGSKVVIVDNASPGDDADRLDSLAKGFSNVQLIRAERNGGFAYGNNRGLEAAGEADFYFLLNPDASPRPGALARLHRTLTHHHRAGVVGPRFIDGEGRTRASAFLKLSPLRELFSSGFPGGKFFGPAGRKVMPVGDRVVEAAWIPGAAMLVRREVIERIGPMDEGYFLYFEETDWLEAAGRLGFKVLCDPRAVVEHLEGQSTKLVGDGTSQKPLPNYWYESWRRFYGKNRKRPVAIFAALSFVAGHKFRSLRGGPSGGVDIDHFLEVCLKPLLKGYRP